MHSPARFLTYVLTMLLLATVSAGSSIAGEIKVSGKGIYQIIPSNDVENGQRHILTLKDYALLEETVDIEAVKGSSFGFEFVLEGNETENTVLKINHPKLLTTSGIGYTTIHSFPVILKPGQRYFAGWNFSEEHELQPGKWVFRFDLPDSPVCEFNVTEIEELIYDGNELTSATAPAVTDESYVLPSTARADLPYGGILTRYLVRAGIYPSLKQATEGEKVVKGRGYEPFIFVREKYRGSYLYYLFIKMFDSKDEATEFATWYRQNYRRKAVPQKVQIRLAPMD